MIDTEASFWSVPPAERGRLWVEIRLGDHPDPTDRTVGEGDTECVKVQELIDNPPDSEFAVRSLMLYSDAQCQKPAGVNPLLLEVDRGRDDPENLESLLDRTVTLLRERRWAHRIFSTGEGYHIEVPTRPVFRMAPDWVVARVWVKQVGETLGAYGLKSGAHINAPRPMMRMVGSSDGAGGRKLPVSGPDG